MRRVPHGRTACRLRQRGAAVLSTSPNAGGPLCCASRRELDPESREKRSPVDEHSRVSDGKRSPAPLARLERKTFARTTLSTREEDVRPPTTRTRSGEENVRPRSTHARAGEENVRLPLAREK